MKEQKIWFGLAVIILTMTLILAQEANIEVFEAKEGQVAAAGNNIFFNVAEGYAKTLNNELVEANLTANSTTSWTFGNQTINVQAGTNVIFKNGIIQILGNQSQNLTLIDKVTGNITKIILGNKSELTILRKTFLGKDFEVNGIKVKSGSLSIANGGYVLGKNSLADWKGLTLGNGHNLFLATSQEAYDSWKGSAIFPEENKLVGKGEDFKIKFNQGNPWAKIDPSDNFAIKAGKGFEFSLENRNMLKMIPLANLRGEFIINENSKSIYTNAGKILITKEEVLFGESNKDASTSPIELFIDGQKGKILVSNFGEIAAGVPITTQEFAYESYEGTILPKYIKTSLTYNYPTQEILKEKYGLEFETKLSDELSKPKILRELNDYLEFLPVDQINNLKGIHVLNEKDFAKELNNGLTTEAQTQTTGAFERNNEIYLRGESSISGVLDFPTFRHEVGHTISLMNTEEWKKASGNINYGIGSMAYMGYSTLYWEDALKVEPYFNEQSKIRREQEILHEEYENMPHEVGGSSKETEVFSKIRANAVKLRELQNKIESVGVKTGPKNGFIRPYGASSLTEDISTYLEKVNNPSFFKDLLNPNNPDYDIRYQRKLDLLLKYRYISQPEYDTIMKEAGLK